MGKLDFGRVGATSATDLSMLCLTGVAIKAWMLPASGLPNFGTLAAISTGFRMNCSLSLFYLTPEIGQFVTSVPHKHIPKRRNLAYFPPTTDPRLPDCTKALYGSARASFVSR